jgi:hypothetical protein
MSPSMCRVLYVAILVFCIVTYIYVYVRVFQFVNSLPTLSGKQELIKKVSFRLLLTALSFVILIVLGVLLTSNIYNTAVGQSLIHFLIFMALNAGSSFTTWAFIENLSKSLSSSGNSGKSKTASAAPSQFRPRSASLIQYPGGRISTSPPPPPFQQRPRSVSTPVL